MLGELFENPRYLCWSFSLAEDYFWHASPQSAVVVHFRKSEVFKGQVPKLLNCIIR